MKKKYLFIFPSVVLFIIIISINATNGDQFKKMRPLAHLINIIYHEYVDEIDVDESNDHSIKNSIFSIIYNFFKNI